MNDAQMVLLARLRDIVDETPRSGALNAAGRPLYVTRFSQAIEARAEDGPTLVEYVRSYNALIRAGRADLTAEAVVADFEAPWASEFTDDDRAAARARLGAMLEAHSKELAADEAAAVEHDRVIVVNVNVRRAAEGKPHLTTEQERGILDRLAARRGPSE
jgi:hypothetical protein